MKKLNSNIFAIIMLLNSQAIFSCRSSTPGESRVKWGQVAGGASANILNLEPNQSISICTPGEDWTVAAKEAIEQWATVIGRWGHFKILNCGESSDLPINMQPFEQTGLNYFSANPGKIFIASNAEGNFLKAVVLHEYGHSFGMCDQYPSVNNCTQLSSEKDDSEVMGTTHQGKIRLTPGDIEGVKQIAANQQIEANVIWQKFLAANPQPNDRPSTGADELVYVQVQDSTDPTIPKLRISVPSGADLTLCVVSESNFDSNVSDCVRGDSNEIRVAKDEPISGRDTFSAVPSASQLSSTSKTIFLAKITTSSESKSSKFSITKK